MISPHLVLTGLLAVVAASCAPMAETPLERNQRAHHLTAQIQNSYPTVDPRAAREFAAAAVESSAKRRGEWQVKTAPWLHNTLVNTKIRERGLCYQWAQHLYVDVEHHLPPTLRMTLIRTVDNRLFTEHHAISLHGKSDSWSSGILLDGWKGAGNLWFYPVADEPDRWEFESHGPYLPELNWRSR
ncbi:MAG: hypothetical protein WED15_07890 [Akkermansiaceae bacterium]